MNYSKMITEARAKGVTNEKIMNASINAVDAMLEKIKESDPDAYWKFMREHHATLYGNHYNMAFAEMDVKNIHYTDADGNNHTGGHWSCDEILNATSSFNFPSGTTDADKYVAFNSFYADTCKILSPEDIIKSAYEFYFHDEDAPNGKIWIYTTSMMY